jgi:hypothetical protein
MSTGRTPLVAHPGEDAVAQLNNRQRATIGGAVVVFLGALIAAAALAQSTRNQSDPTPTNGALFAATSPSPTVTSTVIVSPVPSPVVTVTKTVSVTKVAQVTVTSRAVVTHTPGSVNAGTGGQAWVGGLSPGAAVLGMSGVSVLAVGSALMARNRTGARL